MPAKTAGADKLNKVICALKTRAQTLSIAESCSGGLVSAQFTKLSGASEFFLGGVVSYSNEAKQNLLDVPGALIKAMGAVSTPVAIYMAQGVREKFHSTWSISITGIAGPSGGTLQKPVGTVCFAVCGPGIEESSTQYFTGERTDIQNASVTFAVEFLARFLTL